jgi:DNA-directed RNA polymerase specialized sigma24 family protein
VLALAGVSLKYGLTGGPLEEVEDLTADTFARAWKARHTFGGDPGEVINDGATLVGC